MIKDLENFKLDLRNFHQKVVPANHTQLCKRIAVRLHQSIVAGCPENPLGTPVDTGWARANWGMHIGRAGVPTTPMGKYDESRSKWESGVSSPISSTSYFNIPEILSAIGAYPFIWIYNNVPYILTLEDGHSSTQAPTGMVANALNTVQTFINNDL